MYDISCDETRNVVLCYCLLIVIMIFVVDRDPSRMQNCGLS